MRNVTCPIGTVSEYGSMGLQSLQKDKQLFFSIKRGQMRGIPLLFGPSTPVPSGRIHFAVGLCGKGGICGVVVAQIGNFKSFVC